MWNRVGLTTRKMTKQKTNKRGRRSRIHHHKGRSLLLDTTVVRYLVLYDRAVRDHVESKLGTGQRAVTAFIRMEFLRGVLAALAECYFVLKQFATIETGLYYLSQEFSTGKLKLLVECSAKWMGAWRGSSKAAALRRFGNLIFDSASIFL